MAFPPLVCVCVCVCYDDDDDLAPLRFVMLHLLCWSFIASPHQLSVM